MIVNIDSELTYENQKEKGMYFSYDIWFDPQNPEKLSQPFRFGLENGCVLGKRHSNTIDMRQKPIPDCEYYGFYIPAKLDNKLKEKLPIDRTLNRANAAARGYTYDTSIPYGPGFYDMVEDLMVHWYEDLMTFGQPDPEHSDFIGIYNKIKSR